MILYAAEITGPHYRVAVERRGEYYNVFFQHGLLYAMGVDNGRAGFHSRHKTLEQAIEAADEASAAAKSRMKTASLPAAQVGQLSEIVKSIIGGNK